MDIIVEPYEVRAGNGDQIEIARMKPYQPGDHGLGGSYFSVYLGPVGPDADYVADSWAEVLSYLSEQLNVSDPSEVEKQIHEAHPSD